MDKIIILFLLIGNLGILRGQGDSTYVNLIPNPSMERANRCVKYDELCCPEAWRSTTLKLFHYLNNMNSQRATNQPIHGHRMIAMCVHDERVPQNRAFAQVPLLCPLEAGISYELSFFVRPSIALIGKLGVRFQERMIVSRNNGSLIGLPEQVLFPLPDTVQENEWIELKRTFIAKGGEQVMILGNFTSEDSLFIQPFEVEEVNKKRKIWERKKEEVSKPSRTYYQFDQFVLKALDSEYRCRKEGQLEYIYQQNARHVLLHSGN